MHKTQEETTTYKVGNHRNEGITGNQAARAENPEAIAQNLNTQPTKDMTFPSTISKTLYHVDTPTTTTTSTL